MAPNSLAKALYSVIMAGPWSSFDLKHIFKHHYLQYYPKNITTIISNGHSECENLARREQAIMLLEAKMARF